MSEIKEFRGVRGLVYAEVTKDNNESGTGEGYVTGTVKSLAGVAEISRTTETSSEAHYYDNQPAIVIDSVGSDELTISVSAIDLSTLGDITGQTYDSSKGMLVEGDRTEKYFAIGYITEKTDGTEVFVWRLKGKFSVPDQTNSTKNNGTDANGQELTFTGIATTHKFTSTSKTAKAINVDTSVNTGVAESTFFGTVQTPDTVTAPTPSPSV